MRVFRATMSYARVLGRKLDERSHQEGNLGGTRTHAGGDGNARHRQRPLLLEITKLISSSRNKERGDRTKRRHSGMRRQAQARNP